MTSPAQPPVSGPSSTTTMRFVLRDGREDGRDVERTKRPEVDDLADDPVGGECLGGLQRLVHAVHRGDDRDVRSLPCDAGDAEGHRVTVDLAGDAVEALVLEEEHGVVVLDRGAEKALRVGRSGGGDDLQPRNAHEPGDGHLRVDRAESAAGTHDGSEHERHAHLLSGQEPVLRRLVDDAVHHQRQEVAEHDLDHRTEPGDRGPEGRPGERELRDRRVEHPLAPVLLVQTRRHGEHSACEGHVLAEEDHAVVGGQLLVERLADGGAEVDRRRHRFAPGFDRSEDEGQRVLEQLRSRAENRAASAP